LEFDIIFKKIPMKYTAALALVTLLGVAQSNPTYTAYHEPTGISF